MSKLPAESKYAEFIGSYLEGKKVTFQNAAGKREVVFNLTVFSMSGVGNFKIEPWTKNINGCEVNEPLTEAEWRNLQHTLPRVFYLASPATKEGYTSVPYNSSNFMIYLRLGLIHLTPQDAAIHGKALRSFFSD